jgi:predicted dinucleotide-binding enzyme
MFILAIFISMDVINTVLFTAAIALHRPRRAFMKVTVIGAGNMGSAFVKQLTRAGHQVSVTARDGAKAVQVAAANPGAKAVASAGAAEGADVVVLATGYADAAAALRAVGGLQGKVVVDITNPLTPDYMGLTIGHTTSAAEEIAKALPGTEVVKAFNTVFAQVLAEGADFGQGRKVSVFVAADSEQAKHVAGAMAESMGFRVVDAGGLRNARYLEPLAGLNIYLGYGAGLGTGIAPTWIRKA